MPSTLPTRCCAIFQKKNGPPSEKDLAILRVPKIPTLSAHAKGLLREASQDEKGTILRFRSNGRLAIYTNGFNLVDLGVPRAEAKWEAALRQLRESGLVQALGSHDEFRLTRQGYEIAALLPHEPLASVS